jgi:hypothetical protein
MGTAELSNEYRYHITYIDVICFCDVGCISVRGRRWMDAARTFNQLA